MNRYFRRLLWRYFLVRLGFDWDPLHWAKEALHDAADIPKEIEAAVKAIVRWVVKECVRLGNLIGRTAEELLAGITQVTDFLSSEIGGLETWAGNVYGDIARNIDGTVARIESDTGSFVRSLESGWDSAVKWSEEHVLDPAARELRRLIHDGEKAWEDIWQTFLRDEWRPALHDLRDVEQTLASLGTALDHGIIDAFHLVEKAWDWLEAFAAHPISELEGLPDDVLAQMTSKWITGAASGTGGLWADFADELGKVLGD